jgi:hypothetical protein
VNSTQTWLLKTDELGLVDNDTKVDLVKPTLERFRRYKGGSCGGMNQRSLYTLLVVLARQLRHGRVQTSVTRYYLPAL